MRSTTRTRRSWMHRHSKRPTSFLLRANLRTRAIQSTHRCSKTHLNHQLIQIYTEIIGSHRSTFSGFAVGEKCFRRGDSDSGCERNIASDLVGRANHGLAIPARFRGQAKKLNLLLLLAAGVQTTLMFIFLTTVWFLRVSGRLQTPTKFVLFARRPSVQTLSFFTSDIGFDRVRASHWEATCTIASV